MYPGRLGSSLTPRAVERVEQGRNKKCELWENAVNAFATGLFSTARTFYGHITSTNKRLEVHGLVSLSRSNPGMTDSKIF